MALMVFDLGGTSVKYGRSEKDKIVNKGRFKTPNTLKELLKKMKAVTDLDVDGIAISSPGSVNQEERVIKGISAIPYIHFIPIYDLLEKELGLPIAIENDANCAGLCEVEIGAAKEGKNVISVVLGTGMGGSVFINRELHVGSHLFGGEFGMTINTNNRTASKNGTLVATTNRYNKRMNTDIDGIQLLELYDNKEEVAVEVIEEMFDYIAETLYNIQVIIDPDYVVLGGGISNRISLSNEISDRLDLLLNEIDIASAKPKIVNAQFKNDANLLGAVINYKKTYN